MARSPLRKYFPLLATLFVLALASARLAGQTFDVEIPRQHVAIRGSPDPKLVVAMDDAFEIAERKLELSECRRLFSEFRDAQGRTLEENLGRTRQTGSQYLEWLVFSNGAHETDCARTPAAAVTSPGSRRVAICPRRFLDAYRDGPGYAAAVLIHEELHSLGLGENPPTSLEITQRVILRCGH